MTAIQKAEKLARSLIQGEFMSLTLYESLIAIAGKETQVTIQKLIAIERGHLAFWETFFHSRHAPPSIFGAFRMRLAILIARVFGDRAIFLILESTEVHAIRHYFSLWEAYRNTPEEGAIKKILVEELHDEEIVIMGTRERGLSGGNIRNLFLGLNDGLVEILGAVSGLFAAFQHPSSVLVAAATVAIAGSFSMAAGVFAAESSENEIAWIHTKKEAFLNPNPARPLARTPHPFSSALIVGVSYFAGSLIPILPVLLGSTGIVYSFLASGTALILVSTVVSFLTGMNIQKRIFLNTAILALAVLITYAMGTIAKSVFNITM